MLLKYSFISAFLQQFDEKVMCTYFYPPPSPPGKLLMWLYLAAAVDVKHQHQTSTSTTTTTAPTTMNISQLLLT